PGLHDARARYDQHGGTRPLARLDFWGVFRHRYVFRWYAERSLGRTEKGHALVPVGLCRRYAPESPIQWPVLPVARRAHGLDTQYSRFDSQSDVARPHWRH